jgi:hypothetical protein
MEVRIVEYHITLSVMFVLQGCSQGTPLDLALIILIHES